MKNIALRIIFLLLVASCSTNESNGDSITVPFPKFELYQEDVNIKLVWSNPQEFSYTIYSSIDEHPFVMKGVSIRKGEFVDHIVDVDKNSTVRYRLVPNNASVDAPEALANEQKITNILMDDEELLDLVQRTTLKYFYDFAEPKSKMIRERSNDNSDVVTTGGTGFGVMALIVGAERGFITRDEALSNVRSIVDFLMKVERFHGAYAHWYHGGSGDVKPFSPKDNGGDLVETALLMQGLLTARQYFSDDIQLVDDITQIWEEIDWQHYTRGENTLYWHWSKEYDFQMNMQIKGWNEALIVYVLAASSPTHPISAEVYDNGWANEGKMLNGNTYYNHILPAGPKEEMGGPLFLSQYSFLGLDPNGLSDKYITDYYAQCRNHALINRAYCIDNPKGFAEYSDKCWGLTASDCPISGYLAHSPGDRDNGTISPTAALGSMPFVPNESIEALRYFYRERGDGLWGEYGFYDAFNVTLPADKQVAKSHLAIDQGPIVIMIENHRTKLLWSTFMKDADIHKGLNTLGFTSPYVIKP